MEKTLIMVGIIDEEGYELENRVYARGGISPTQRAGNARINVLRAYGKENHSNRIAQPTEECTRQG